MQWIEVEWTALEPADRREGIPDDTAATPLRVRARGMAVSAEIGKEATVTTVIGREVTGLVREIEPGYHHSFGKPLSSWLEMRDAIRRERAEVMGSSREGAQA
ncbi:2-amino-4-oxopentanoate thiolase subunit OrtA [Streptomyces sp. NPDC002346]